MALATRVHTPKKRKTKTKQEELSLQVRLPILFTIKTRHKRKDSCVIIMKKRMSIDNLTVMKSAVSRAKTVLELYSRMDDLIERRAVGRMAIQKDQKSRKRTQSNYPAWSPKAKEDNSKQLPSMVILL